MQRFLPEKGTVWSCTENNEPHVNKTLIFNQIEEGSHCKSGLVVSLPQQRITKNYCKPDIKAWFLRKSTYAVDTSSPWNTDHSCSTAPSSPQLLHSITHSMMLGIDSESAQTVQCVWHPSNFRMLRIASTLAHCKMPLNTPVHHWNCIQSNTIHHWKMESPPIIECENIHVHDIWIPLPTSDWKGLNGQESLNCTLPGEELVQTSASHQCW